MAREEEHVRRTVSFKPELDAQIQKRIREGGFSSLSDYLRATVRDDLKRTHKERLEAILLERIGSEEYSPVTEEYFEELRGRIDAARKKAEQ